MEARRKKTTRESPSSGTMPVVARPRTAVVIDDHQGLLDMLVEALRHEGWSVRGFQDVEEALPYVRASLPDIVLTDMNVGVLSGAALARELRLDPATRNLAVVGMSGSMRPSPRTAALFDEFLFKPVELGRLASTLSLAIARRRA